MQKTVKIFLASSNELESLRNDFELFISRKNNYLINHDIFLEVVKWESFLDNISKATKQDDYNKAILECTFFVSVFYSKAGEFTVEELKFAYENYIKTNKPQYVYTYFIENKKADDSIKKMIDFLISIEHYRSTSNSKDAFLLKFGEQLEQFLWNKKTDKLERKVINKENENIVAGILANRNKYIYVNEENNLFKTIKFNDKDDNLFYKAQATVVFFLGVLLTYIMNVVSNLFKNIYAHNSYLPEAITIVTALLFLFLLINILKNVYTFKQFQTS